MKLESIKDNRTQIIQLVLKDNVQFKLNSEVQFSVEREYLYITQQGIYVPANVVSSSYGSRAQDSGFIRNERALWFITHQKEQNSQNIVSLQGILLDAEPIHLNMHVGITDYIVEQLYHSKKIPSSTMNEAIQFLQNDLFIENLIEEENFVLTAVYSNQSDNTLNLIGETYIAEVTAIDSLWSIEKLTPIKRKSTKTYKVIPLTGNIEIKALDVASRLDNHTYKARLKESINDFGGYIDTWNLYSTAQWELAVARADKLGYLSFDRISVDESQSKIWKVYADKAQIQIFKESWQNFDKNKDDAIEINNQLPDWLDNAISIEQTGLGDDKQSWRAKIVSFEDDCIVLKYSDQVERAPPRGQKLYLYLSIYSILLQRQRQLSALDNIRSRKNSIQGLHHLLQGIDVPVQRIKKLKWDSPKTKKLFKGGKPTIKQRDAIELGLNCTDVCIVIGPPGTGKTQVITAIQQRLIEEQKYPLQHSVLLTSYQHDAVDNVLSRSNPLGIAAVKVGGKQKEESNSSVSVIDQWAKPVLERLSAEISQHDVTQLLNELAHECRVVKIGQSHKKQSAIIKINEIIDQLSNQYSIYLDQTLIEKWDALKSNIVQSHKSTDIYLISLIRSLRTKQLSFIDDGARRCLSLITALDHLQAKSPSLMIIQEGERQILNQFAYLMDISEQIDFVPLKNLQNILLDRFLPDARPNFLQRFLDEGFCNDLAKIELFLSDQVRKSSTLGYLMVLDNYRKGLMVTSGRVKKAMESYTTSLGATCQQAASKHMQFVRSDQSIKFENVIVDEAARATPLDLMIPMSMAEKRIVLVGDHRQLPHMLDDRVEKQLDTQDNWKDVQQEMLEESLFQRLVKSFDTLHKEKGQPLRVVMLDTQFRMHPVLGEFISRNFYENHGLPPIKSGRPEEDFIHGLHEYGKSVCAFKTLEVDSHRGIKNSWERESEARWIAEEAKKVLDENPALSVGVISFYGGQVERILHEMSRKDLSLTIGTEINGQYQLIEQGKNIGEERLRVGTVDAFQGKEFDVVFVSLVRTISDRIKIDSNDEVNKEKQLNQIYGFLRVDNRLNVALSRQRSLLVLVGSQKFVEHSLTADTVPALPKFLELCRGDYGKIF